MLHKPPPEPVASPSKAWADMYADWYENGRAPEYRAHEAAMTEIEMLRIAVVRYCDRGRMSTVDHMGVQQAIDRAFEATNPKGEQE